MNQSHQQSAVESPRERILKYAVNLFRSKGVRGARMDDIAVGLGMSKRTLYEMFGNKENLLLESMRHKERQYEQIFQAIAQHAQTPVEIYVRAMTLQLRDINDMNPTLVSEASKYPPVRQYIDENNAERTGKARAFLQRCQSEGYLRSDMNIELLLRLQHVVMRAIMNEELYKEFALTEIIFFVNYMNFRGQCTEKGMRELERCIALIQEGK